jgi:hypothetical protein
MYLIEHYLVSASMLELGWNNISGQCGTIVRNRTSIKQYRTICMHKSCWLKPSSEDTSMQTLIRPLAYQKTLGVRATSVPEAERAEIRQCGAS